MEEWIHQIIDYLPIGLLLIDRKNKVQVFNQRLSRLTGLKTDKILGQPFREVLNGLDPNLSKLQQTLDTEREFQDLKPDTVLPFVDSDAYQVNTYIIRDHNDTTIGAMAVFMPVERQLELEQSVIKAEKLAILGQLAAGAVHEIKNPLTTINGFLQLLQKDLKGTPKEEYLRIILDELKHVNRLISDFLQLAKPGYSKRGHCSINKLIKEVFMLAESEASISNFNINLNTAKDIPQILADGEQLKQVFLNIIRNAFEALSNGGELFLQTSWDRDERSIRVIFKDTGTGMDNQTIATMFDPFFTTKDSGTGLGMFISKKIIDNHGGSIEVESKQGRGTTVTVLLPTDF